MDANSPSSISAMQNDIIRNHSIGERLQERLEEAEVCERCEKRPPEVISEFSSYVAVCEDCYETMKEELRKEIKAQKEFDERYGY